MILFNDILNILSFRCELKKVYGSFTVESMSKFAMKLQGIGISMRCPEDLKVLEIWIHETAFPKTFGLKKRTLCEYC